MELEYIISVVSTTGFLIACCVYLFYERDKAMKELKVVINDFRITLATKL